MATTKRLSVTRDQLAAFLKSHELVKQFEKLFQVVDEVSPEPDTAGVSAQAGNAIAAANEVSSHIARLTQDMAIRVGTADQKAGQALDVLGRIADALELLATAPATQNNNSTITDYIDLPEDGPHVTTPRRVQWNRDDGTVDIGLYNGSVLQVGQELVYYAKNTSGGSVVNGTPVMFTGAVGSSGKLTFAPAMANGFVPSEYMMGVATQDIANNAFGYVTSFGLVRGINTTGAPFGEVWADGDLLYFGPGAPGTWTNSKPEAPAINVPVAVVVKAGPGGSGSIFVRMTAAGSLTGLRDVHITGTAPLAGQVLIYNASQSRWENNLLTPGQGISIVNDDGLITISSTAPSASITQVESPTSTGFTVNVNPVVSGEVRDVWLLLNPTSAFASGTIVLPAAADRIDRQIISVSCTQQINALTINGNGATVKGAPSVLAADDTFKLRYNSASTTWYAAL